MFLLCALKLLMDNGKWHENPLIYLHSKMYIDRQIILNVWIGKSIYSLWYFIQCYINYLHSLDKLINFQGTLLLDKPHYNGNQHYFDDHAITSLDIQLYWFIYIYYYEPRPNSTFPCICPWCLRSWVEWVVLQFASQLSTLVSITWKTCQSPWLLTSIL